MSAEILIVDDEKAVRESLQDILELEGYTVEAAGSGETALEMLNEGEFDLILLDLKMPGIDGVEVMHQANLLYASTKIIILTGHGSLESAIAAVKIGAHDYILKPFETEDILTSIEHSFTEKTERQRKELLIEQLESSLNQLKDVEGITTPELPGRRIISLPQGIMVDLERREIWRGSTRSHLTPTESKLLGAFLENRARVMTHEEIVFLVQGYETSEWEAPEVLRPMISRLRKKLAVFPGMEEWVSNVRGTGYVFDPNVE
ncbi:MAG: Response regulator MprA [Chloroflexi bacterium]|nr:Response regulator MprA [Chloroflexota bacterium]